MVGVQKEKEIWIEGICQITRRAPYVMFRYHGFHRSSLFFGLSSQMLATADLEPASGDALTHL